MSLYAYGGNGGYGGGGDRFGGRRDVAFEAQHQALLLELRQTHARLEMLLALTRHKDERLEGLEAENENLVSEVAELKKMIHKQRAEVEIAEAISEQLKDELKVVQREKEALQGNLKVKDQELKEKIRKEADGAGVKEEEAKLEEKLQKEADVEGAKEECVNGEDTDTEFEKAAECKTEIQEKVQEKSDGDAHGVEIREKVPEEDQASEVKAEDTKIDTVEPEDNEEKTSSAGAN